MATCFIGGALTTSTHPTASVALTRKPGTWSARWRRCWRGRRYRCPRRQRLAVHYRGRRSGLESATTSFGAEFLMFSSQPIAALSWLAGLAVAFGPAALAAAEEPI